MTAEEMVQTVLEQVGPNTAATELGLVTERVVLWINSAIDALVAKLIQEEKFDFLNTLIVNDVVEPTHLGKNDYILTEHKGTLLNFSAGKHIVLSDSMIIQDSTCNIDYLSSKESVGNSYVILTNDQEQEIPNCIGNGFAPGCVITLTMPITLLDDSITLARVYKHLDILSGLSVNKILSGSVSLLNKNKLTYPSLAYISGTVTAITTCDNKPVEASRELLFRNATQFATDNINPFVQEADIYTAFFHNDKILLNLRNTKVKNIEIYYIRIPRKVCISTDTVIGNSDCDLPLHLHPVVCEMASALINNKINSSLKNK